MKPRFDAHRAELVSAVFEGQAASAATLRRAVRRAAATGQPPANQEQADVPAALRPYVHKVSRHAYRITDGDIAALKANGFTEEFIFEITVSAAVGAGLDRLATGLALLEALSVAAKEADHAPR